MLLATASENFKTAGEQKQKQVRPTVLSMKRTWRSQCYLSSGQVKVEHGVFVNGGMSS